MIESRFWKEELLRIAESIKPVAKPVRWSERQVCIVERDLMIGFFIVRRLIELHKVSSQTKRHELVLFSCPARINHWKMFSAHDIIETYDLEKEKRERKDVVYVSNQFVHSVASYVFRDQTRNWSDVFITSDRNKKTSIWRIPIQEIRKLFLIAARDYPSSMHSEYDTKANDWVITTD